MRNFFFGTLFAVCLLFSGYVSAQVITDIIEDVPIVEVNTPKLDFRVEKLMATSTLDVLTATQIVSQKDDNKAITDRLDSIIHLLRVISKK
jgi:hypothetical protein